MTTKNSKLRSGRKRSTNNSARFEHPGPLKSLSITNFRGIRKLEMDGLAPLTIFTGDNGAGKTTLLEAIFALYGRTNPTWVLQLQGYRGLSAFSKRGPSYLGLFYGPSEEGTATLSGETKDGTEFRLRIERPSIGQQTVVLQDQTRRNDDEPRFDEADVRALAEHERPLRLSAFRDGKDENVSELAWRFVPPGQVEMTTPGAKLTRPSALLLHPGGLDDSDRKRFGDVRQAGKDEILREMVELVDPRLIDVEYLETSHTRYFRAKLKDGRALPLGMLGGGVVQAFRHALALVDVGSGLLAIDEVENGLYHRRLPGYFKYLFAARQRLGPQVVLATHSYEALAACVTAATEGGQDQFAVVHLRRDESDLVHATVIPGRDAKSSLDHGFDLR